MRTPAGLRSNAEANEHSVYGKVIMTGNQDVQTNDDLYQRMKSKIAYGFDSAKQFTNKGSRSIEGW